jgi:hypothetical protein
MPALTEDKARFWSVVFGGITAVGLVFGGLFAVIQYQSDRETALTTASIQASTARFEAKKPFYTKQLDFCELASSQAAILATPTGRPAAEVTRAKGEFWRLYWGPLGIVEDKPVEGAMIHFGQCLGDEQSCGTTLTQASLKLAHACRDLVSKSWDLGLPPIGDAKAK